MWTALRAPNWVQAPVNVAIVYVLTCFAWVYFRAGAPGIPMSEQIPTAHAIIGGIFTTEGWNTGQVLNKFIVAKGFLLIGVLLAVELYDEYAQPLWQLVRERPTFRVASFASVLWLVALFGVFSASAFIYFQF